MFTRTAVFIAAVLSTFFCASQWQFKLDTTFRTEIIHEYVNSLILETDGKLIVSGVMRFPGEMSDKRLVRLMPNGVRDESYNNSGLGGGKLTPWEDGKFYVGSGQGVRRILPTGQNDPSYILNGGPYFTPSIGGDYHVFEDGRVLVTGSHNLSDSIRGFVGSYKLIWFSNEGYLDTTRIHRQANGALWSFTALPDGKFLCSCNCTVYDGQPVGRVFRIHADGELDTTFVSDITIGNIYSYFPLEDGRVYVAGKFLRGIAPLDTLYMVRLMQDGTIDPTFATLNFHPGDLPNPSTGALIGYLHPWHDGMMIVNGRFRYVNGQPRQSMCLIDSTGNVLPPFHDQGIGTFQFFTNTRSSINHIVEDDLGRLYIAGAYTGYNDGTINDPGQRFVSRLLVEEVNVAVQEEKTEGYEVTMHPNPSSGMVHISMGNITGQVTADVHDALRRRVAQRALNGNYATLDLQALPDGVYFITLHAHDRHVSTQRVVLQR